MDNWQVKKFNKQTSKTEIFECPSKRKANEFKRQLKYELNIKDQLQNYNVTIAGSHESKSN